MALRYAPGHNPNGSGRDIAAVTNEAGNVLGLMPHPEHAVDPLTGSTDGLRLFEGAAGAAHDASRPRTRSVSEAAADCARTASWA